MPSVMDDSLVSANGIYVYTHAIVSDITLPKTLAFIGDQRSIRTHEEEIIAFIRENHDDPFFACQHYQTNYRHIRQHVTDFVNKNSYGRDRRITKLIHRLHVQADQIARETAIHHLDEILEGGAALQGAAKAAALPARYTRIELQYADDACLPGTPF